MPTYEELRDYFQESGELQDITRSASKSPIVIGFTLDVNPWWAMFHDLENGLIHPAAGNENWRGAESLFENWQWFGGFADLPPHLSQLGGSYQGYRRRDLKFSNGYWEKMSGSERPSSVGLTLGQLVVGVWE
jgi:hypothetical protein